MGNEALNIKERNTASIAVVLLKILVDKMSNYFRRTPRYERIMIKNIYSVFQKRILNTSCVVFSIEIIT